MPDYDDALAYLRSASPGHQPLEIFRELARIAVLPIYEIVLLRSDKTAPETEVLLSQRAADDAWWPNSWHVPGTVMLATDTFAAGDDFSTPLRRIIGEEIAGSVTVEGQPKLLLTERRQSRRGHELAMIFWAHVDGEPAHGRYFPVDALPADILEHQERLIAAAAEQLKN